jgi:hypothetical protein
MQAIDNFSNKFIYPKINKILRFKAEETATVNKAIIKKIIATIEHKINQE